MESSLLHVVYPVTATGKVYVTDTYNHRIQVFAAEGTFLRKYVFGSDNEGSCPAGIAIDTSGLI